MSSLPLTIAGAKIHYYDPVDYDTKVFNTRSITLVSTLAFLGLTAGVCTALEMLHIVQIPAAAFYSMIGVGSALFILDAVILATLIYRHQIAKQSMAEYLPDYFAWDAENGHMLEKIVNRVKRAKVDAVFSKRALFEVYNNTYYEGKRSYPNYQQAIHGVVTQEKTGEIAVHFFKDGDLRGEFLDTILKESDFISWENNLKKREFKEK